MNNDFALENNLIILKFETKILDKNIHIIYGASYDSPPETATPDRVASPTEAEFMTYNFVDVSGHSLESYQT
jgi:hypothetical protein